MKKIAFFISIFIGIGTLLNAQTDQGDMFLGGSPSGDLRFDAEEEGSSTTELSFNISGGYFITDGLGLGMRSDFAGHYTKHPDDDITNNTSFSLSPVVRYYEDDVIPSYKAKLYVEGYIGYGFRKIKRTKDGLVSTERKNEFFTHGLGIGMAYFVHDFVSVNGLIGYRSEVGIDPGDDNNSDWDVELSVGISVYF